MRIGDFDLYRDLLLEQSGLELCQNKSYLLDSRLTPVSRKWNFASLEVMTMSLRGVPSPDLLRDVVDAMMITETSFFRDFTPFEQFQNSVLPYLLKNRPKRLRILSAGCSTGQETYSLALVLKDLMSRLGGWQVELVGLDISARAIDTAQKGDYTQLEVQRGVPSRLLLRHFDKKGDRWLLKNDVRNLVKFKTHNLLSPFAPLGRFDVIFCRNVLSGLGEDSGTKMLHDFDEALPRDGFLFLGKGEKADACLNFEAAGTLNGVFVKTDCPAAPPFLSATQAVRKREAARV